ncbi:rhodanese-like domain-containing protein [Pedobacter sp. HMF7647]|uniref:Rhodanese-like domain-containing protein n=1 Tax=Hufsiella arboris TaxID=2695275 RepID=A0A7K1Y799_9SPHI|nr:rhodanese-like domain-containing protein [Hufsiella arboris]MXV50444.1 rhodanese-like domain-containing protein [Hufsiella arboris]
MDILPAELKQALTAGKPVTLIDVREELEFNTFNIGGINVPLGRLPSFLEDGDFDTDAEIVVICQRGLRSETARRQFVAAGYLNVKNLKGGLLSYNR